MYILVLQYILHAYVLVLEPAKKLNKVSTEIKAHTVICSVPYRSLLKTEPE